MSARLPQYCVAVLAVTLVVAPVAPWVTTASAATTGAATAAGPSASFQPNVVYEQRGDVANITVVASQDATVNIGSRYNKFLIRVTVEKGTTKLRLNTYKAGESDRYALSEMVWATQGTIKSRTLETVPIDGPLEPAEYHMNVTIDGHERDVGTLVVTERQTKDITARIAPRATDVSKLATAEDVRKATVPPWSASVAHDDWLLVHVNATGVRGALEKSRLDGDNGVMRVSFVQRNPPPNGPTNRFTGASVERMFVDGEGEGFYLAVDTGDHGIEAGDEYRVSFTVPATSPLAETAENVTTWIRVAERRVNVNKNGPGDGKIVVDGETTISGSTTLTPGTTINISARDTGTDPFLRPRTVEVREDRTFGVTFDFSNLDPGREFEFRLGDQDVTIPAVVARPTTTTTTTTTTTEATTTATTTTRTATTTTTTTPGTTDGMTQKARNDTDQALTQQAVKTEAEDDDNGGPVPGFGPVAALVALAAGLALATRRL